MHFLSMIQFTLTQKFSHAVMGTAMGAEKPGMVNPPPLAVP
jgi:hypothetical protein